MKKIKQFISFFVVFALVFASCSKEEAGNGIDSEKATLSFGAILTDMATNRAASKAHLADFPECTVDAPVYVEVVLMQGEDYIVGTEDEPYRVDLAAGEIFTVEDPELELIPGTYNLTHFAVYNAEGDVIWIAPRANGSLAGYVDSTLPMAINLGPGVKKYVDVSVLCFDNRDVNEYGYLFYELNTNVALEFCFFANYCDSTGRHFPARYSVNIWKGLNANGTPLYTNVENNVSQYDNGDFYASPLCFALPDNDDVNEDYLYYEVTLLDWDDNYGTVPAGTKITGTLSKQDILNNFGDGDEVEYEHIRFGCGDDGNGGGETPTDSDNDGIPDSEDDCDNEAGPASNNGCPVVTCDQTDANADCDNDGVLNKCDRDNPNYNTFDCDGDTVLNGQDGCPSVAGPVSNNGCPVTACDKTDPNADCDNDGTLNKCDTDNPNYGTFDCDGDNVLNSVDNCDDVAGPASNNGCPVAACDQTDPNADCDNDGVLNKCDSDNPNYDTFDCDGDNVLNSVDNCPTVAGLVNNNGCPASECISAAPEGCTTFTQVYNVTSTFDIIEESYGDFLIEIANGELFVGYTPVAPFNVQDMQIKVNGVYYCADANNIVPADGAFVVVDGITASDLPLSMEVKINACDIQ